MSEVKPSEYGLIECADGLKRMGEVKGGGWYRAGDYDALAAECERLRGEVSDLHTTMMAAAVEIQGHWAAHCDEEGYGPANLMHRLERGIAAQYGYNAETVVCMEAQRDAALAELAELNLEVNKIREAFVPMGELMRQNSNLRAELAALKGGQDELQAQKELMEQALSDLWSVRIDKIKSHCMDAAPPAQASAWPEGAARSDTWLEKWARDKFTSTGRYKGRVYGNTDWALARALHTAMLAAAPTPAASDGKGGDV